MIVHSYMHFRAVHLPNKKYENEEPDDAPNDIHYDVALNLSVLKEMCARERERERENHCG